MNDKIVTHEFETKDGNKVEMTCINMKLEDGGWLELIRALRGEEAYHAAKLQYAAKLAEIAACKITGHNE